MEELTALTEKISGLLWGWPLIIMLVGTHIYLTIKLRFPQRHLPTAIRLTFSREKDTSGDVSAMGALSTALAATIGTGNIVGVGTAIALGGPGAVFWCWLTGVLGMATKYGEGLLAVKYRVRTQNGEMLGGPMYALERGLGMKWLAVLFCIFASIAAFGIGNMVQANSVANMLHDGYNIPTSLTGAVLSAAAALVMLFGVKGIARVCSFLVPFMAFFYIAGCIVILFLQADFIVPAALHIVKSAFSPEAATGGMAGAGIAASIRYGVSRGLFSNESGLGSAPIVAAAARAKNPVRQALVSMTGTFWDTVVICALTGIVLVSSMLSHPGTDCHGSTTLIRLAFSCIPAIGPAVLSVGLLTFAASTLLGWSYYGEKAIEYLGGKKIITFYRTAWVVAIFCGAVMKLQAVWNIADSMNALMALPNLISLVLLTGVIKKETKKYLWSGQIDRHGSSPIEILKLKHEHKWLRHIRKTKK